MKVLILLLILGVAFGLPDSAPLCPPNSYHTDSGTACPLTCKNYKKPPQACIAIAVSGCQCSKGYVRLDDFDYKKPSYSICVPSSQCEKVPVSPPEPICPPNAYHTVSGTACPLTCKNYKKPPQACIAVAVTGCQCSKGYVRLDDFDYQKPRHSLCVLPTQCSTPLPVFPPEPLCFANSAYVKSGSACPLTCNNYKNPPQACPTIAVAACQCNAGFVRLYDFDFNDPKPSLCIQSTQCPIKFPGF